MSPTNEAITLTDTNWRGNVLVWDEYAIFIGQAADVSLHESPAIKVCVALEGNFGLRTLDDAAFTSHGSAVIAPGQPHAIDGRHNRMVMLLLAPETKLAQRFVPLTLRSGITPLSSEAIENIRKIFAGFEERFAAGEPVGSVCDMMVEGVSEAESSPIDSRIAQGIEWIRARRDEGVSVQEIAAGVELSESRFSHLFTENVRIPVRRYLLWLRLRDAMHLLAQGRSLTETAHEAGFSDSAHLARTFRTLLGIAPSALTKESVITSFLE
ncbi:AraC family transcriptional regulator [soil metagenome]